MVSSWLAASLSCYSHDVRFDLGLFQELNQEYAARRSHKARANTEAAVQQRGLKRAESLDRKFGLAGKRCLEVGAGRGEVVRALAEHYGVEVVGVDVERHPVWDAPQPAGASLLLRDISTEPIADLGHFDLIFSFSVWEHVRRPYEALAAAKRLLAKRGDFYLSANLYRGSQASHRYREVYFPWPHLLFTDEVFEDFYRAKGKPPKRPAWVNRLSAAEYHAYFEALGFSVIDCSYSTLKWDEAFYRRFEDVLGRYPRADLERDFINVHLRHKPRWRRAAQKLVALEPRVISVHAGRALRSLKRQFRR